MLTRHRSRLRLGRGCRRASGRARAPAAGAQGRRSIEPALHALPARVPALLLLVCGAALAWLPPVGGLPLSGYGAIAALLFGAVLLVPG